MKKAFVALILLALEILVVFLVSADMGLREHFGVIAGLIAVTAILTWAASILFPRSSGTDTIEKTHSFKKKVD
jgi:hypothetical protein